jgi:hypothetical protein
MVDPNTIKSPKSQIEDVEVIYNGTLEVAPNDLEFSIAKLKLRNGNIAYGIRHDRSYWSSDIENGYPVARGIYPCWFILPNMDDLLPKLNELFGDKK